MKKLIQTTAIIICVCMIMVFPASAADIEDAVGKAQSTILNVAAAIVLIATGIIVVPMFIKRNNIVALTTLLAGGFLAAVVRNMSWIEAIGLSLATKWLG